MFEALGDKLGNVFDNLTGRGALSEKDVNAAMREIRVALLEADVALPVVKTFVEKVRTEAVGEKRSLSQSNQAKWSSKSSMTPLLICWAAHFLMTTPTKKKRREPRI